jgi:hypothetical protein
VAALNALDEACPLTRLSDDEHEDLLNRLRQVLIEPAPATASLPVRG